MIPFCLNSIQGSGVTYFDAFRPSQPEEFELSGYDQVNNLGDFNVLIHKIAHFSASRITITRSDTSTTWSIL
jgi:hypothetical protein